jgi:hypothetical protein
MIDLKSAFNMIDHDTLFKIMNDLGFPPDALSALKYLYTGATSRIHWDTTITAPIPIARGTMQGDSLSSFLFLLYMEPLLRWLQVGGRGYIFGSLSNQQDKITTHIGSTAYADDLAILTNNISSLKTQASKLSQYCTWAHLPINTSKTLVTGALYNNIINSHIGKSSIRHPQGPAMEPNPPNPPGRPRHIPPPRPPLHIPRSGNNHDTGLEFPA